MASMNMLCFRNKTDLLFNPALPGVTCMITDATSLGLICVVSMIATLPTLSDFCNVVLI
jgi:hypothetical protein